MTAKKKIVIVALSDLSRDPRVNRQIDTFKPNWEVTVLGLTPPVHEGTIFHQIILKPFTLWHKIRKAVGLKCRQFEKVYWNDFEPESVNSIKHAIGDVMFDKVIANDVESLPFVFELFPKTAVFLDAHVHDCATRFPVI